MGWYILIAFLVIIIAIVAWGVGVYNSLVAMRTRVQESWNQVDVELQRRHDLIPNLVEIVKAYAGHERNTLEEVVRLRNQATQMGGAPSAEKAQVEGELSGAISRLLVTVEAYPDLKANENFRSLMNQLTETEDRIAAGRRYYNANVAGYNTKIQQFPSNFIANMGKFTPAQFFEVQNAEVRQSQSIDFGPGFQVGPTQAQRDASAQGQGQIPAATYNQAYPNNPQGAPEQIPAAAPAPSYQAPESQPQQAQAPQYGQNPQG